MISVIIPVYNVSNYLADCLDSVLSQDVNNSIFEVIVVDDCSPYGEKEIVDTYLSRYDNVRYIRHDVNKRQGGARNTGIRAAKGEYVMFLDADDCLLYANVLSVLLKLADSKKSNVIRTEVYKTIDSNSRFRQLQTEYSSFDENYINPNSRSFMDWRSGRFSCSVWASLYKREFLLEHNLWFRENVWFEDTDWTNKTLYYAGTIDFIDFPFYGYRQSPDSTTRGYSVAAFEGNVEGILETYRFYKDVIAENNDFWNVLREGFVHNVIDLLKTSRNYPIKDSCKALKKLNDIGLTSLKSQSHKMNSILCMMRYMPLLPICIVKLSVMMKRWIKNLLP